MSKRIYIVLLCSVMFFYFSAADLHARTVVIKSNTTGIYEDGIFTPTSNAFEAAYDIDESGEAITLEELITNGREGRIELGDKYEITNIVVAEGLSAFTVEANKRGQKIITAVREADLGASEMLIIGENFYDFCKSANGKIYLEHGSVVEKKQ
ncbi:MAG: hypothetical protein PHW46_06100 [Candidatus Omnitrophica bacterium]|nr:hypothetical protein [Candidatus Omnitrophota bacterium]